MYIDLNTLSSDEKIFSSKIEDMFKLCDKNNVIKFTNFLDERQKDISVQISNKYKNINYCFFAGANDCERAVMCVFPQYLNQDDIKPPLKIIGVKYRIQDKLTHRDFLGALMSLKIKRDTIGDIIVEDGHTIIVAADTVSEIIINEIKSIGRVGVECFYEDNPIINRSDNFVDINCVVSSFRLDCIISAITGLSREKSLNLIKSGFVTCNFQTAASPHKEVALTDKITIRGYGKFIVSEIGSITKKNRIHIVFKKYL